MKWISKITSQATLLPFSRLRGEEPVPAKAGMAGGRMRATTGVFLLIACFVSSGCMPMAITSAAATTASIAHDRRTLGTMLDDQGIELKAQAKLFKMPEMRGEGHVVVTSYNNIVLLTGQVPYDYLKNQISDTLASVPQVKRVFNELQITDNSSLLQRSQDSWTTTKIKSALIAKGHIDPTHIKVITENDIVYLLGLVNFEEAQVATEIAQQTSGVKEVIRAFEYL